MNRLWVGALRLRLDERRAARPSYPYVPVPAGCAIHRETRWGSLAPGRGTGLRTSPIGPGPARSVHALERTPYVPEVPVRGSRRRRSIDLIDDGPEPAPPPSDRRAPTHGPARRFIAAPPPEAETADTMTNLVIEAAGLTKFYGPRRGVEDVTFSVPEGEAFGFLDPMAQARPPPSACCWASCARPAEALGSSARTPSATPRGSTHGSPTSAATPATWAS